MPKVSVGILTYNRKDAVLEAIQSAYDQGVDEMEIVVVDSASTDGTAAIVRERYPDIKLVCLPRNLGCPGGRNHVFANCTGDYIVSLDDDGYLGEGAVRHVVETFDADPTIGIVAMRQCYTGEPDAGRLMGEGRRDIANFWGGVSAHRRAMLEKTGYYPEDFFLYAEESYLSLRALDAGYKIVSVPDAIMWHPRLGMSGAAGTRWDYYRFRNPLLTVARLFPGWLCAKYLVLRLGSYARYALRRGTPLQYARAVAHVFWHLPKTLLTRQPCSVDAVRTYFRIR